LRDAHVKIVAQVDGKRVVHDGDRGATEEAVARWGQGQGLDARAANARFRRAYWLDDIQRDILGGQGRIAGNNRIQYGFAAPGIGYLAFASMGGFIDAELASIRRELPVLDAAMDEAIAHFESGGARAVIVDVSFNTGGYDFVALAIAGRFAARQTLAYNRRAGDDPAAVDFPVAVVPANGARFTGPVHLLTADPTASAAEVLVLAMRSLDNVTHVGERTRGAFSTALMKYLPNGWELSLSNEIYTDPRGIVWEGRGIAPQVPLTVFYPDNPLQGHVEAVRALARSIKP
jgi:carboxyl-terminal processing protease